MTFFVKNKQKEKRERGTHSNATTTTSKSQWLRHQLMRRRRLSALSRAGGGGTTTETNMAVSFTVYSSTPETWYKEMGLCLSGLSFVSSRLSGVDLYKSHLCVSVGLCKLQRGVV